MATSRIRGALAASAVQQPSPSPRAPQPTPRRSSTPACRRCPTSAGRPRPRTRSSRRTRRRTRTWRRNPNSNIHNDTWMTDAYQRSGPARAQPRSRRSERASRRRCAARSPSTRKGRIVSVCPSLRRAAAGADHRPGHAGDDLHLRPADGARPAGHPAVPELHRRRLLLPRQQGPDLWSPTKTDHIFVLGEGADGNTLTLEADYDLTGVLDADDRADHLGAARLQRAGSGSSPSRTARSARSTRRPATIKVKTIERGDRELVRGRRGRRLHRLRQAHVPLQGRQAAASRRIVWKSGYPNSGIVKPSQVDAGSGTTPTIMDGGYVAITDNADPMNVVVYRTATKLKQAPEAQGLPAARLRQGRERDRELAARRRALAHRREQLRLPGPVRAQHRRRRPSPASPAST